MIPMEAPVRVRRDCVFMKAEDGILFRTRNGPFSLKGKTIYETFSRLLPHLDGRTRRDAILNSVRAEHRKAVTDLLALLEQRGVLQQVDLADARVIDSGLADAFAPQIDFIAHYTDRPNARFLNFRRSKVLLDGAGHALASAGAALLRNGLEKLHISERAAHGRDEIASQGLCGEVVACGSRTPDEFDLVLYCSETPHLAEIQRLNAAARRERFTFLPAIVHERHCITGPIVRGDEAGCWMCAMLRWAENTVPVEAARFWKRLALDEESIPTASPVEIAARILGNTAAMEVFKHFIGEPRSEATASVLLQEIATLESSTKRLVAHGDCPHCTGLEQPPLRPTGRAPTGDITADVLGSWEPLMGHRFSLLGGFRDDDIEQLPLRVSRLALGGAGTDEWVFGCSLDNSDQARLQALRHAVERIALRSAASALRGRFLPWQGAVPPSRMAGWRGNAVADTVCRAALPAHAIDGGATHTIPAGAVLPALDTEGCFDACPFGIGVGDSQEEALRRGLLSLAEYRTVRALTDDAITVSRWNCGGDRTTQYLLAAAAKLSLCAPVVALAEFYRGAATALVLPAMDAPIELGRIVFATEFSQLSAVNAALTRWLAEEQLRLCGHPRTAGGISTGNTFIDPAFEEEPAMPRVDSGEEPLTALLADAASRNEVPLWLDITPRDIAATQTFRVVKVALVVPPEA